MIGPLKLIGFGFLALTVIYLIVRAYALSVRRERLKRSFDGDADRDSYIAAGLSQYRRSLGYKLLWLVYILPIAVIILTAYMVNSQ